MRAVITGDDFAAPYGVIPIAQNEWPLARDKVRYRGEPLFAVAADDEASARAALAASRCRSMPLPAYFTRADARADGALPLHDNKPGNIERRVEQDFGDVDAGFAAADLVLERALRLRRGRARPDRAQQHASLQWEPERERLTVHSVTQVPYYLHLDAGADARARRVADPRRQAVRRRRLRPPRRAAELRDGVRARWRAPPAAR